MVLKAVLKLCTVGTSALAFLQPQLPHRIPITQRYGATRAHFSQQIHTRTSRGRIRRRAEVRCELTPLSSDVARKVLPISATRDQWMHYWGEGMQRAAKVSEVAAVAILGLWACFFMSFFLGVAIGSLFGFLFAFYWLLGPNISAANKQWAFRGKLASSPGESGSRAALFSAKIVELWDEVSPLTGKRVKLRLEVADEQGRALAMRVPITQQSAKLQQGMRLEVILVSDSPNNSFQRIAGVSDAYIPEMDLWIGDYPYLSKIAFLRLLAEHEGKLGRFTPAAKRDSGYSSSQIEKTRPADQQRQRPTNTRSSSTERNQGPVMSTPRQRAEDRIRSSSRQSIKDRNDR